MFEWFLKLRCRFLGHTYLDSRDRMRRICKHCGHIGPSVHYVYDFLRHGTIDLEPMMRFRQFSDIKAKFSKQQGFLNDSRVVLRQGQ